MTMTEAKTGSLAVTLATWIFLLDSAGNSPDHEAIAAACGALRDGGGNDADALGQALVAIIADELSDDASYAEVQAWLAGLYGSDRIGAVSGDDRQGRIRAMRAYQFSSSLPLIAQIIDRFPDGTVGPHWVMVERVTDTVSCMDPYPWDDLDEEYKAPLVEFMVKWELAGGQSVLWNQA